MNIPLHIEISKEWAECKIDGGIKINKKTRLAILRNKIKKHFSSKSHITASSIISEK